MESAYAATLPARERRLAGRLEGFGDIVFGFAVSQCAIELPTTNGYTDIRNVGLLGFFGTFAILASLWPTFHSIMSGSFKPTRLDLFLAFAYLALVTLMSYAPYAATHPPQRSKRHARPSREAAAAFSAPTAGGRYTGLK